MSSIYQNNLKTTPLVDFIRNAVIIATNELQNLFIKKSYTFLINLSMRFKCYNTFNVFSIILTKACWLWNVHTL